MPCSICKGTNHIASNQKYHPKNNSNSQKQTISISNENVKESKKDSKKDSNANDKYTKEVLQEQYNIHKNYVINRKESSKKLEIEFRLPCIPEDITENMIKYIIHKNGDKTSKWSCKTGDLLSDNEGKQECKSFTSDGPISFTPSSDWDNIYFLDARNWLQNKFILYKVNLKRTSNEFSNIKINKNQTFIEQCNQGRRPRINWNALYPQIQNNCTKIFDGTFEDIFI